ncbi:MAG: dihydroneopterin aldolase [candidate division KSB1 bacterium]|nr:dihydroneopterin aldolase [candidate division KSB1 bacterium]
MKHDKLSVMGMIFHAHHGLEQDEMKNGQRFEVDIEMLTDIAQAAATDNLKHVVDVREVYRKVESIVVRERFYLIETLSERIARTLLDAFDIHQVTVRVRKPFAPLGGLANGTQIEITRKREQI